MNLFRRNDFVRIKEEFKEEFPHISKVIGRVIFNSDEVEVIFKKGGWMDFYHIHYSKLELLPRKRRERKIEFILNETNEYF